MQNVSIFLPEKEPEIFNAIRFGTILENVVLQSGSRIVDYNSSSITQNTRASYPIEFISNAKIPCIADHPKHIVFLTCDAFGVIPPVSKLTAEQAMYHFISGYTAKVAGTEMGVTEPQATFSACFGEAFMVWHPSKYAEMLAQKIRQQKSKVWLVNTGWSGGEYGVGKRINLAYTRTLIDAIHSGALEDIAGNQDSIFKFNVPVNCPGVPESIMQPRLAWESPSAYNQKARQLAQLFIKNFEKFKSGSSPEILGAGPII